MDRYCRNVLMKSTFVPRTRIRFDTHNFIPPCSHSFHSAQPRSLGLTFDSPPLVRCAALAFESLRSRSTPRCAYFTPRTQSLSRRCYVFSFDSSSWYCFSLIRSYPRASPRPPAPRQTLARLALFFRAELHGFINFSTSFRSINAVFTSHCSRGSGLRPQRSLFADRLVPTLDRTSSHMPNPHWTVSPRYNLYPPAWYNYYFLKSV
jgi:hypothetical protein